MFGCSHFSTASIVKCFFSDKASPRGLMSSVTDDAIKGRFAGEHLQQLDGFSVYRAQNEQWKKNAASFFTVGFIRSQVRNLLTA